MIAFVRHGQTGLNRSGLLQGRADGALTDLGRAQAAAAARAFAATPPARVVASPLRRAVETAAAIAAPHGLDVEVDDRLLELDYGEWDERPVTDVSAAEWEHWRGTPDFAPPGGESLRAVAARVAGFCCDTLCDDLVVAVSHVSPIKAAVVWALGGDESLTWRLRLDLASISRVAIAPDGRPYLVSFNETTHLPTV